MKNKCDWNINVFVSSRAALSLKMYEHSLDQCSVSSQHPLWVLVHRSRQQRGVHQNSQADLSTVCNNVWLQSWSKEDASSISLPPQGRGIQCLLSTIQTRNRGTATTEGVGAPHCPRNLFILQFYCRRFENKTFSDSKCAGRKTWSIFHLICTQMTLKALHRFWTSIFFSLVGVQ